MRFNMKNIFDKDKNGEFPYHLITSIFLLFSPLYVERTSSVPRSEIQLILAYIHFKRELSLICLV
jgi:hypothetical protein